VDPVAVVIPHWNQPDRCVGAVAALRRSTVPVHPIIVDSGSTPRNWERLERAFASDPAATLLRSPVNLGFGPATNLGWAHFLTGAGGAWVGVAPHDAEVDPDTIERLVSAGERRPRAGLVSADVGDGASPVVDPYFGGILRPATTTVGWEPVHHPHGTLFLARRALLEDVGGFDPRYFSYCEEADLGERARRRGWEVGQVRGARVRNTHLSGAVAVVDYLQVRNTLLMVREHFGRYRAFVRLVTAIGQTVIGRLSPARRPLVFDARARMLAIRDHLRRAYGPPPADLQPAMSADDLAGTLPPVPDRRS
jgi:N-acetylglucosaminyl-diphospho-decaprenol L-rhamnosyltransferase